MKPIDQAIQTVFADLGQRCLDAAFDADFPENGNFNLIRIGGRDYWYYNGYDAITGRKTKKYVGPKSDADVTRRVEAFGRIKDAYRARLEAVRLLKAAGFPSPDTLTGALLDALAKAGFFRLRGVLIGTIAFQTYPGLVGARPDRNLQTGDIDLAQDHGIALAIDDRVEPLLEAVQRVDETFQPRPGLHGLHSTALVNARGYKLEFLVPNRGTDDEGPTPMPTLGDLRATPLRYLDFLIRDPVRSVALHGAGVSVLVPAPERYAVHKLIVATQRPDREKQSKDVGQAEFLIHAMAKLQSLDLGNAWTEVWERGPRWRENLTRGIAMLAPEANEALQSAVQRHADVTKPTSFPWPR